MLNNCSSFVIASVNFKVLVCLLFKAVLIVADDLASTAVYSGYLSMEFSILIAFQVNMIYVFVSPDSYTSTVKLVIFIFSLLEDPFTRVANLVPGAYFDCLIEAVSFFRLKEVLHLLIKVFGHGLE